MQSHVRIPLHRPRLMLAAHYVKSRAAHVNIASCSFDAVHGKGTNYMINLPEGATGQISKNLFVQGRDKDNYSAFIAVAAEGKEHPSDRLSILGNGARFAPGVSRSNAFLADWSGDPLNIGDNQLGTGLKRFERR